MLILTDNPLIILITTILKLPFIAPFPTFLPIYWFLTCKPDKATMN